MLSFEHELLAGSKHQYIDNDSQPVKRRLSGMGAVRLKGSTENRCMPEETVSMPQSIFCFCLPGKRPLAEQL